MNVDDKEVSESKYEGKKKVTTTSPVYIGGVPSDYDVLAENMRTSDKFEGCLGDVTINAKYSIV